MIVPNTCLIGNKISDLIKPILKCGFTCTKLSLEMELIFFVIFLGALEVISPNIQNIDSVSANIISVEHCHFENYTNPKESDIVNSTAGHEQSIIATGTTYPCN